MAEFNSKASVPLMTDRDDEIISRLWFLFRTGNMKVTVKQKVAKELAKASDDFTYADAWTKVDKIVKERFNHFT